MENKQIRSNKINSQYETKEQWLEYGTACYQNQRYAEALEACEHAIQIDPTCPRGYHGKGLILARLKDYGRALEVYEQALKIDPNEAKICFEVGALFFILRNYEKAGIFYRKAIKLNKKYEVLYLNRTKNLLEEAKYAYSNEERTRIYEQAHMFNPNCQGDRISLKSLERQRDPRPLKYCSEPYASSQKSGAGPLENQEQKRHGKSSSANLPPNIEKIQPYHDIKIIQSSKIIHTGNCACIECVNYD